MTSQQEDRQVVMQETYTGTTDITDRRAQVLTVGEMEHRQQVFLAEYLQGKAEATKGTYNRCLNEFARWLREQGGYCPMTRAAMDAYLDFLVVERAFSARTVATYVTALRQFCKYLAATGFLRENPSTHLKTKLLPYRQSTQPLSEQEILDLLAAANTGTPIGKRDVAIMFGMLYAGLTEVEIERANIEDMQLTLLGTRLRVQARGKADFVPLDAPVVQKIDAYLKTRPAHGHGDPLFLSHSVRSKGGRLDSRSIRRRLSSHLKEAGIHRAGVTPQSLSLTAILLWLNDGMSMEEIRIRMRGRNLKAKIRHLNESGLLVHR